MELYGTFFSARKLVDAVGNVLPTDVSLVGCVIEDERFVFECIVNPSFQLLSFQCHTLRIVRVAEVNDIDMLLRQIRHEVVFRRA